VSFETVDIDDVAYEKFNNVSVYVIIRDNFFENNNM